MMKKLLGCTCSKAKVDNGNLVLSLTDAMTPALWVISLSDHPALLLKVAETEDGLFVLQKITHTGTAQQIEDLAYYAKKGQAIRAMEQATHALSTAGYKIPLPSFKILLAVAVIILGIMNFDAIKTTLSQWGGHIPLSPLSHNETQATMTPTENTLPDIRPSSDPDAVGVPLSADAFLEKREPSGFMPF